MSTEKHKSISRFKKHFGTILECQPWTPAVATPRGAGVPERPRNRTS
ncbi:hypothetical protein X777_03333 [Ooceraea biroi]|uniref:Uncharacterized protein n=1 Tax=Ooceraea biroi TaxID=2015173 RepID=A0A026WLM1_OOCBI|nr:hypothetical protein X777_03333 [Ooceraea biroi]